MKARILPKCQPHYTALVPVIGETVMRLRNFIIMKAVPSIFVTMTLSRSPL